MARVLIAGDFCPQERVQNLIEIGNYEAVLGEVVKYTSDVDYSIVNLEAPVVDTFVKPIEKCGPNLKCTSNAVKALKYAGFDMVTLANNHFYDYGDEGVKQTLDVCRNENIVSVGGGMNIQEASRTCYLEIKGVRIAIINCCEHEFSIATDNSGGANPLNTIQQYYRIKEAKIEADCVIVIVHGGTEMYQLPSPRMKETYRFFIDAGADAVVNHHQHCYSGYEVYKEKPIFYGIGNFLFDWENEHNSIWNEGYIVVLKIENKDIGFELFPYIQGGGGIQFLNDRKEFEIEMSKINLIIANDECLQCEYQKWVERAKKTYTLTMEPYRNRYLAALYVRGLLPSFITKSEKLRMLNFLRCEAHLECMINALK